METTDKTFLEMQQQMQQLREKLDSQKIVNERLLRRSCGRTIDHLRIKSNAPIVAGLAGLALIPFLHHLGFSPLLLIVTGVFMIAGIVATLITKQYIPNLNKDLVTVYELNDETTVVRTTAHPGESPDESMLKELIEKHVKETGSAKGKEILSDWMHYRTMFKKVIPNDYLKIMTQIAAEESHGLNYEDAVMAAFKKCTA